MFMKHPACGVVTLRGGPFSPVQDDTDGIFIDTVKAVERRIRADTVMPTDAIPGAFAVASFPSRGDWKMKVF